jgi:hypothetical protein
MNAQAPSVEGSMNHHASERDKLRDLLAEALEDHSPAVSG